MAISPSTVPVAIFDTGMSPEDLGRLNATIHIEPGDSAFLDDRTSPDADHAALVGQALRKGSDAKPASGATAIPILDVRVTGSYGEGGFGRLYPQWGSELAEAAAIGARVANYSFVSNDIGICRDVAAHPDIVMVAAAGNVGVDLGKNRRYPASCPDVITVTILDGEGKRPDGNFGDGVDFASPIPLVTDAQGLGWGGTSMGAGYTSGIVATMRGINPALSPAQIEEILCRTVRPVAALAAPVTRCGGTIDEAAALDAAVAGSQTTQIVDLPPTVTTNGATSPVSAKKPTRRAHPRPLGTKSRSKSSGSDASTPASRRSKVSSKRVSKALPGG
jgi:hypothetical protein